MANTRVKLNDNTTIPLLAFGTGTAHFGKGAENMVTAAVNAGFTHFDGAQIYRNEESLGAGIAAAGKPREQLFVTTKLNKPAEGKTVRETLVESLAKLQLEYVDLFLIHIPLHFPEPGRLKEVWKEMEALKKEGLARSVGVSNFRTPQLREILDGAEFPPSVNQMDANHDHLCQVEFHPYVYKELLPTLELQKQYGIVIESYGGLSPIFRFKGGPLDPVLESIAKRLSAETGKSFSEAQGAFSVAATTSKESRLPEYLGTFDAPKLTDDDIASIDEAGAKEHHRYFVREIILD
ncbi:Aldo/keto reductase [Lactarius hatsudake]|nr:Aldo/keto reductase [Lactarius hatsudake]